MTGTSVDALDAALISVKGTGLEARAAVCRCATRPLGPLADPLRRLASQEPMAAGKVVRISRDFALLHIEAVREAAGNQTVDLIAVHGQTVFHAPPLSWQLLAPAPLVQALHAPVVFDLRAADLAAGGQGAPITPLADFVLFRHESETRAIVNLGGYCNVTILPGGRGPDAVLGGDVCACNQVLDGVARAAWGQPWDVDGRRAERGVAQAGARDELVELLRAQAQGDRSLGTGDELASWINRNRKHLRGEDLARTACDGVATVVTEGVASMAARGRIGPVRRLLLAGGGVKNRALRASIAARSGVPDDLSDAFGVPAAYREAVAIGVLGALCADGIPITLPQVTRLAGPAPLAGAWVYPG